MVNQSVLYQTNETLRDAFILRRWKLNFNGSRKPVFHPTNGREAETATLFGTSSVTFYVVAGGFRPRHLKRYVAPLVKRR